MILSNAILLRKTVNWSMLVHGIAIPLEQQRLYASLVGQPLQVGGRHEIKVLIDGEYYDAHFDNVAFDRNVFNHPDIVRLMYGVKLQKKLQSIFASTYAKMLAVKATLAPKKQMPEFCDIKDYIVISASTEPDVFIMDCFTEQDEKSLRETLKDVGEQVYEHEFIPMLDSTAGYTISASVRKIRHLDRSIGESLKKLYDYRCQMTGERIGEQYDALCVEAHHIDPFTTSLNNDYSNIIILSPTYHRIIHKANPMFNHESLAFEFPNGLVERVKVNKHL